MDNGISDSSDSDDGFTNSEHLSRMLFDSMRQTESAEALSDDELEELVWKCYEESIFTFFRRMSRVFEDRYPSETERTRFKLYFFTLWTYSLLPREEALDLIRELSTERLRRLINIQSWFLRHMLSAMAEKLPMVTGENGTRVEDMLEQVHASKFRWSGFIFPEVPLRAWGILDEFNEDGEIAHWVGGGTRKDYLAQHHLHWHM